MIDKREEFRCQCELVNDLSGGNPKLALAILDHNDGFLPKTWRVVINMYEDTQDRVCNKSELKWDTGVLLCKDPVELVEEIKRIMEVNNG